MSEINNTDKGTEYTADKPVEIDFKSQVQAIKRRVANVTNSLTMMDAMRLPRHERRRLAKLNKTGKILGSSKPFVRPKQN